MTNRPKIAAVDLFCGVGGLTYGLESAGIDVRLGVDIDPECEYPISENTGARFEKADVGAMKVEVLEDALRGGAVRLLAGCAPCQPFSTYAQSAKEAVANDEDREARDDWKLVGRFGDFVKALQPDLVTMENVPPLARQPVFRKLLSDLEGYSVDYRVVECRTIGLPQRRKRLVLVASKLGPISIPEFEFPEKSVRKVIGDLPKLEAGQVDVTDRLHRASSLSKLNLDRIRASIPGGTWRDWPEELRAACHVRESGGTYPSVYGRMEWDEPAPTITTQCFGYGNGRFGHPEQDRAISLREAAMLQGFPRDYAFIPSDEPVSFAKLGRLIGNAVPVTLGEMIGKLLVEHVQRLGDATPQANELARARG
ncbi:DNA cytosine methyltransferase [Devosia sp. A16]|uniref:DNA cytosine methyltransferase n=1 Tax=Devosia sp. A16 TaxID=1736675 RepID=UPI0009E7950D|nr:DNA cytosine methyltransferase [Devosia sp. A16]